MSPVDYFHLLVQQWHEERPSFSSSIADMIACPSYLRIIAMGHAAVPCILEQLQQEGADPDHWHAALEAITGENPVPEAAQGDTIQIAEAWIAWGERRISHFTDEMNFRGYSLRTIESPALEPGDITASPGQLGHNDRWWEPARSPSRSYWPPEVPQRIQSGSSCAGISRTRIRRVPGRDIQGGISEDRDLCQTRQSANPCGTTTCQRKVDQQTGPTRGHHPPTTPRTSAALSMGDPVSVHAQGAGRVTVRCLTRLGRPQGSALFRPTRGSVSASSFPARVAVCR